MVERFMLKMTLFKKIVAANLLTILLLACVALVTQATLSRNLMQDFMSQQMMESLSNMAELLEKHYLSHGSWDKFKQDTQSWGNLLHEFRPRQTFKHQDREAFAPFNDRIGNKPPPPSRLHGLVSLFDKNGKPIIFSEPITSSNHIRQNMYNNGELIGWLLLPEPKKHRDPMANHILQRGKTVTLIVTAIGALIAIIISLLLSRHITQPLHQLTTAAGQLSERNFNLNLTIKSNDELEALSDSFNQVAVQLNKYDTQQKQWLLDISHELRTPLTILQGEIEAMVDGVTPYNAASLYSLKEEIIHLSHLVNDLHELSITDNGSFTYHPTIFNFTDLLNTSIKQYKPHFREKKIELNINVPKENVFTIGDHNRLMQVLKNIFSNILTHSNSPGAAWVKVSQNNKMLNICIEDSGPGVSDEILNKLFNRLFRKEQSRNRKFGGTGIGLSICKNIITRHNGAINAEHSSYGGIAIKISLPANIK